jgi:hypothetical protein
MKMADLPKDKDLSTVRSSVVRVPNDFIPQGTKVALELGKSVAYVKLGEHPQDVCIPRWDDGMEQFAGNMEQDDE